MNNNNYNNYNNNFNNYYNYNYNKNNNISLNYFGVKDLCLLMIYLLKIKINVFFIYNNHFSLKNFTLFYYKY